MNAISPLTTAGGTLSGPLFLADAIPVAPLSVASRAYVDAVIATTPTVAEFEALREEVRQLRDELRRSREEGAQTPMASPPAPTPQLTTSDNRQLVYTAPYFQVAPLDSMGFLPIAGGTINGDLAVVAASDPVSITVPAGGYARVRYTVAGTRAWTAGAFPDGSWRLTDETTPQIVLSVLANNNITLANSFSVFGATPPAQPSWAAPTGTALRTTFDPATVTLPVLAEHVKAVIDDLTSYGLFGP